MKTRILKNTKIALVGLTLPFFPTGALVLLTLLPFVNSSAGSVIGADKLILLTVGLLSPLVYISGAAISIVALLKSEMRITAFMGTVLNITLLSVLLYFSKSFLVEFKFIG